MRGKILVASGLIAVSVLSAVGTGWQLSRQRPIRPAAGSFHRSKVDRAGHTRGVVQVDLMRQILADTAATCPATSLSKRGTERQTPSLDHPLLGSRAPTFALKDATRKTWDLDALVSEGPVVVVFYLGFTCTACVTHLVELDAAKERFRERGARVMAISSDAPEFSRDRIHRFGGFQFPLLSDVDHATGLNYGVWKTAPGEDQDDGEALHGTFLVDRDGLVRWAYVGNQPFTDIEALVTALDRLSAPRAVR